MTDQFHLTQLQAIRLEALRLAVKAPLPVGGSYTIRASTFANFITTGTTPR